MIYETLQNVTTTRSWPKISNLQENYATKTEVQYGSDKFRQRFLQRNLSSVIISRIWYVHFIVSIFMRTHLYNPDN